MQVHAQSTYCTGNDLFSEIIIIQRNTIYKMQAFEARNISILVCTLNMSLVIKFSPVGVRKSAEGRPPVAMQLAQLTQPALRKKKNWPNWRNWRNQRNWRN